MDTLTLIQEIRRTHQAWQIRHAEMDAQTVQLAITSRKLIAKSHHLLERTKDLPGVDTDRHAGKRPSQGGGAQTPPGLVAPRYRSSATLGAR
jgi:hypothetical protein